jgi:hypothetical protein
VCEGADAAGEVLDNIVANADGWQAYEGRIARRREDADERHDH